MMPMVQLLVLHLLLKLLRKVEADIQAKKQMAGARAALESVLGLIVRVLV